MVQRSDPLDHIFHFLNITPLNALKFLPLVALTACTSPTVTDIPPTLSDLPTLSVNGDQGVSGAFAGQIADRIVVAGGCNFPDTPAAEGGAKVFYSDIYLLDQDTWKLAGHLPHPLGYGASVTTAEGIVCIGGTDGQKSRSEVWLLHPAESTETDTLGTHLDSTPLPSLPTGLDNFDAAYDAGNGCIYVAGGQTDGVPSHKVWRLAFPDGTQWEALPDMPGEGRLQPCVNLVHTDNGDALYVFGGFATPADSTGSVTRGDAMRLDLTTDQWTTTAEMVTDGEESFCLVGAQSVTAGQSILFFGGVNRDIFNNAVLHPAEDYLTHPIAWYQFRSDILVYDTTSGHWSKIQGDPRLARAGAQLVAHEYSYILICGESKPGIRANSVTAIHFPTDRD